MEAAEYTKDRQRREFYSNYNKLLFIWRGRVLFSHYGAAARDSSLFFFSMLAESEIITAARKYNPIHLIMLIETNLRAAAR